MSREKLELTDLKKEIENILGRLKELLESLDTEDLWKKKESFNKETSSPDFFKKDTREFFRQTAQNENLLKVAETLDTEIKEAQTWDMLMDSEDITPLLPELRQKIQNWKKLINEAEGLLYLNGPYDENDAILSLHAGAGGTDAQDWTEMLLRMYLRWAEKNGFRAEVVDLSPGEEAGIKSVTVMVYGPRAYGLLRNEKGVHRLVRISPFDANRRRHTSFALVDVIPQIEASEVKIDPDDLRIETFRASGHGGQNVQKTDTAIRITHLPTGIVVQCQNERSQMQNRNTAMKILLARIHQRKEEEDKAKIAQIRGDYQTAAWGNQIRSYVLHPYNMVKDHRTELTVGDVNAVLDGDINEFIWANLRHEKGN